MPFVASNAAIAGYGVRSGGRDLARTKRLHGFRGSSQGFCGWAVAIEWREAERGKRGVHGYGQRASETLAIDRGVRSKPGVQVRSSPRTTTVQHRRRDGSTFEADMTVIETGDAQVMVLIQLTGPRGTTAGLTRSLGRV
jgi:hypothetical protein